MRNTVGGIVRRVVIVGQILVKVGVKQAWEEVKFVAEDCFKLVKAVSFG